MHCEGNYLWYLKCKNLSDGVSQGFFLVYRLLDNLIEVFMVLCSKSYYSKKCTVGVY